MLTTDDLESRLAEAEAAARHAGRVLLGHYAHRGDLAVETKGRNDFVSDADRESEEVITRALLDRFPGDGFLGEESGVGGTLAAESVWCIDPLDGTTQFLKGAHNWCVSIGLHTAGRPVLGVVYDPLRDEMFTAALGLGATCNGAPIHVSDVSNLAHATIGIGHNARIDVDAFAGDVASLLSTGAGFTQVGAAALMLAYVAAGRADAYVERHLWAWDAVAGLALIAEAGGAASPFPGSGPLERGGSVIAGPAPLHEEISRLLSFAGQGHG